MLLVIQCFLYNPGSFSSASSVQINDLPGFLRGKDRDLSQHIRITYLLDRPAGKGYDWLKDSRAGLPAASLPARRSSDCPTLTHTSTGKDTPGLTTVLLKFGCDISVIKCFCVY